MLSLSFIPRPRLHRNRTPLVRVIAVRVLAARVLWPPFVSPRAELAGSPSLARPSLFAGD